MTSRQERYVVLYTRNDTGEAVELQTRQAGAALADLHPGAGYRIQVTHSDSQHMESVAWSGVRGVTRPLLRAARQFPSGAAAAAGPAGRAVLAGYA